MQVWNRNRGGQDTSNVQLQIANIHLAAPQQPPKHLTDEELKQQYGIHLATRIQADGDGKEAKWADIDDDEDDWAPETIEWNDGTKISLAQNDSAALLAEKRAAEEAAKKRQLEEKKARAAAEKKPITTVGPNATILKPRSAAQPKPGTPLVLKTPLEKPTLVSKPAAPTPTKSPWAPLPAIDKVPPIEINPPVQIPVTRPQQNGIHPQNSTEPPPPPAMEIAADSFKRGGNDSQKDGVGQLFNAGTGKYEPANAGRRGSVRKDGNFRAPSVLQRGGPTQDATAPAEPSPAFQTRRMSQNDHVPWERRKSSNVSGDGLAQARRQSLSKGSEVPPDRRGSQQSQAMQSPTTTGASLSATQSPAIQNAQLPQDVRSLTGTTYHARAGSNNMDAPGERDEVVRQKRLMKEKREEAIKRRREEEEREEAEKKERIRKKMEELGMEPLESKETKKKDVQPVTIEKRPVEAPKAELEKTEIKTPASADPRDTKTLLASPSKAAKSPPKPPAPSTSGEPQQYGMMKVHSSAPRDPLSQVNETLNNERSKMQTLSQKVLSPAQGTRMEAEKPTSAPLVNGVVTQKPSEPLFQRSPELSSQRSVGEARQQPWNDTPKDSKLYAGWNSQQVPRDSNSVWGAPSQSRPLGNGTFDRTIQRPQSRPQEQYPSPALAPIGPPKHLTQAKDIRDTGKVNGAPQPPNQEDSQTIPSFPFADGPLTTRVDMQGRIPNGEQKEPSPPFPSGSQLGPPKLEGLQRPQSREQLSSTLAAWGKFELTAAQEDTERNRQWQREQDAITAEEARTGVRLERQMPHFFETWKQVKVDDQNGGRSVVGVSRSQNAPGLHTIPHSLSEFRSQPFNNSIDVASTVSGGLGRGSRFFPSASRPYPYHQLSAPFAPFYRRSDSPPPPDSVFHPVQVNDKKHPIVRLPLDHDDSRMPKPKVRLPPTMVTPMQSPQMSFVQPLPLRAASQPLVNNPSWQDRFNGLLGVKKPVSPEKSPEKRVVQIVNFSATKEPLDLRPPETQAAVALPTRAESVGPARLQIASQDFQDEEALFEPESGSTPSVLFPKGRPTQAWPLKRGQMRPLTPSTEVEAASKAIVQLPAKIRSPDILLISIRFPGEVNERSKPMQVPPEFASAAAVAHMNQNSLRQQNSNGRQKHQGKGFKSRESSGSFNQHNKPSHNVPQKIVGTGQPRNNYQRNPHQHSRAPSNPQQRQPAFWENIIVPSIS